MLDLGPRARITFCVLFFGVEAVLIATAGMRSDRSYGFRMFPESSAIVLQVSRRTADGKVTPITGGKWQARDCDGKGHWLSWGKLVRFPAPSKLGERVGAPYGIESETQRAEDAVRWVASNTPEDCETRALIAHIERKKNGYPVEPVDLEVTRDR
jgi:hypothetical protein